MWLRMPPCHVAQELSSARFQALEPLWQCHAHVCSSAHFIPAAETGLSHWATVEISEPSERGLLVCQWVELPSGQTREGGGLILKGVFVDGWHLISKPVSTILCFCWNDFIKLSGGVCWIHVWADVFTAVRRSFLHVCVWIRTLIFVTCDRVLLYPGTSYGFYNDNSITNCFTGSRCWWQQGHRPALPFLWVSCQLWSLRGYAWEGPGSYSESISWSELIMDR